MYAEVALYAALWLSFGIGHSVLAGTRMRARMTRRLGAGERLAYNLIAVVHLLLVLAGGAVLLGAAPALPLVPTLRLGMLGVVAAGVVILLLAMRSYDLGRFSGMAQLRHGIADDLAAVPEAMVTSGLNRYVRHPLYLGLLLVLWGLAITPLALATAACATLYLAIGLQYEERKLHALYGDGYAQYCRRVPALLPWPGRHA